MTEAVVDRLKDFNWALSEYDRIIDVILSNLKTLKEEMHGKNPEKENIAGRYYDTLNFKIETVYSLLIRLEELVFDTTFAYYRKYHGSVRGELSLVEFTNVKREASYIFDSFLMQYKSLLDLVVKFTAEFTLANNPQLLEQTKIDSFEKMTDIMKLDKSRRTKAYRLLSKSGRFTYLQNLFQSFVNKKILLEEIKDYRDYIIHQGYVRHQLRGKSAEGQIIFSYWIPRLVKAGRTYDVDPSPNLRLEYFCREKLYLLLSLIAETTDLIYDESLKEPYISKLKTFSPELVKNVILKISRKEFWADKILSEEELKTLLESKDVDFSELVEDFTLTEGKSTTTKMQKKPHLFEKTYYKPLGAIRLFKTRFNLKGSKTEDKPMYSITSSGSSLRDFISQKPELKDILDTLLRAGLVYVIESKGDIKYASVRYDLMALIFSLDELTRFKWSSIQIPEMNYFRASTPEEIEVTRTHLGDKIEEYLKERDREREEIQKEYQEWKRQPEHYFKSIISVLDKNGEIVTRITHKEYIKEKETDFQNWKRNKHVLYVEKDGQTQTVIAPFFSDNKMDQERLQKLIRHCEKHWKGRPKHFLELEKERIKKAKGKYKISLEKFRKEFQRTVEKYKYLMPVFILLNEDAFIQ